MVQINVHYTHLKLEFDLRALKSLQVLSGISCMIVCIPIWPYVARTFPVNPFACWEIFFSVRLSPQVRINCLFFFPQNTTITESASMWKLLNKSKIASHRSKWWGLYWVNYSWMSTGHLAHRLTFTIPREDQPPTSLLFEGTETEDSIELNISLHNLGVYLLNKLLNLWKRSSSLLCRTNNKRFISYENWGSIALSESDKQNKEFSH